MQNRFSFFKYMFHECTCNIIPQLELINITIRNKQLQSMSAHEVKDSVLGANFLGFSTKKK